MAARDGKRIGHFSRISTVRRRPDFWHDIFVVVFFPPENKVAA